MTFPPKFITAGFVCLVFAALLPTARADGGAAPDAVQIEPFTPAQAEDLAKDFQGVVVEIELPVESVRDVPTGRIALEGLRSIDPESPHALAGYWRVFLFLDGPTTLDAATAAALATFRQTLSLGGLTALDAGTAARLAAFTCDELSLDGLTTLEPDAARALMGFKGKSLSMPQLPQELGNRTPLARDTVLCMCLFHDPEEPIELPSITTLDGPEAVEIATILTRAHGPLSLPNLRKISPKTLAALVEKRDIKIPPLEMLELIPEPGGGSNDDFVIPNGFPGG